MTESDYWIECVSIGADECGAVLTREQIECIAGSAEGGHENYGMAFYEPPASDRYDDIDREWKAKYKALERELDSYRNNAEKAIKRALKQYDDANVSIGEYGEVFRHDGRTSQIQ